MEKSTKFGSSRSGSRTGSRISGSVASSYNLAKGSRSFFNSKGNLHSGSRRGLLSESKVQIQIHQILDDSNNDVTPKPLIQSEHPAIKPIRPNYGETPGVSLQPLDSVFGTQKQSLFAAGNASFMQPFRSVFGGSTSVMSSTLGTGLVSSVLGSMMGSMMGSMAEEVQGPSTSRPETRAESRLEEKEEALTLDDLEKPVYVSLTETETMWHLDTPSTWVGADDEEQEEVLTNNKHYEQLCKDKVGNDKYSERGMQTLNEPRKTKHVQTDVVQKKDTEMFTSDYEMYDTMQLIDKLESDKKATTTTTSQVTSHAASQITSRIATPSVTSRSFAPTPLSGGTHSMLQSATPGDKESSIFTVSINPEMTMYSTKPGVGGAKLGGGAGTGKKVKEKEEFDPTKPNDHPFLKSEELLNNFRVVERAITENIFQSKQAMYRDLPVLVDPDRPVNTLDTISVSAPHLEKLWTFTCPHTRGRSVTSMSWNMANKDIVAVGYGDFQATKQDTGGIICCWSIKNPEHPERIFYTFSGVTSVAFSQHHPNLLAAGLYSGSIELYNCRSTTHEAVLNSRDSLFKHSGPVWQVEWIAKERSFGEDRAEVLVSVGIEGRVLQWTLRKGLESVQLMRLKRLQYPKQAEKKMLSTSKSKPIQVHPKQKQKQVSSNQHHEQQEANISQYAPGMGFAFMKSDTNLYLVCTEEGDIHKCSCSYNEQFLETFKGHTGPVYKVLWHPSNQDVFLSCSSDWTIRLWNQELDKPLHVFQVSQKKQEQSKQSTNRRRNTEEKIDHSYQEAVQDIGWSPHDSTVFVCVRGGRVELWYLSRSVLDPFLVHKSVSGVCQTRALFAYNSNVLLVGNAKGEVSVYMPRNVPLPPSNKEEALDEVFEALETSSN